ncbi:DNA methyltransferase [Candidatus Palauibacter sp.]|uniref:DNA methyltransferase n=1 Tax=Candidatus Palauibacter sp. TaxID=3101350 RepID=UPI003CC5DA9E
MSVAPVNQLYYGDNLEVLRRHVADESVDLVYLDPPFNSDAIYNVIFGHQDGSRAEAQIKAFEDTWRWDQASVAAYQEVVEAGGRVADAMRAFHTLLGPSNMLAYLAMMAPRLVELRRVLKPTGSLYLHCDPTASHYLKLLLDSVFGAKNFRNEITWRRTPFKGSSKSRARQFGRSHDIVLFYSKGDAWTWNCPLLPYTDKYLERFKYDDGDGRGRYRKTLLKTYSETTFKRLQGEGQLIPPRRSGASYSYKQYLSKSPGGTPVDDFWSDINALNPMAKERLSYPTQKPLALMERIIESSSNEGDVVLDPFCGCGTTVDAAQKLGRRWIGIDITHLAINLIRHRLRDTYGPEIEETFKVVGEPVSVQGARQLAASDPYQFQWWALGKVGARPEKQKKGADRGIDGLLFFHEGRKTTDTKQVIISVKAGKTGPSHARDLRGVLEREAAAIGVLISMQEPTRAMREEAASAGFYKSPWGKHPKIQLLTVEKLLDGRGIDYPAVTGANVTFRRAARAKKRPRAEQLGLGEGS